jgi:ubiquinone biosynthesis protein
MSVALAIPLFVLFVVTVGKLTGRLLGIRLGHWRGALVGVVGWVGGLLAAAYTIGEKTADGGRTIRADSVGHWLQAAAVVIVFGVLAAMPVAIGIDLITRSGRLRPPRRRRRNLLHPIRAARMSLAPYGRLSELVSNARHANLLHLRYASRSALDSPDFARRLRGVLEESGGMFVKLGQIASTRTDVLPDELTDELSNLRADVRPVPDSEIREVVEHSLGEPIEQAFGSFEHQPLAAASIGQTHRAVLSDGTRVVVKVQRPGIDEVVARDASVLRLASARLERHVEIAREVGLSGFSEELISGLEQELDYQHEASVGTALRENRAGDDGISIPAVHSTLSTDRVLVMEEVVGRSIADPAAIEASPVPAHELASRLLSSFLGQVLEDGLFHADPHPGNLLIDEAGTIWMLDFGSVGRLDARALDGLRGMALGVATSDVSLLARAARDMSGNQNADLRALQGELGTQLSALGAAGGLDPQILAGVLSVMRRHKMIPPPSITLLARSMFTLEGTLKSIDPGFSFVSQSRQIVSTDHRDAFGTPEELLKREVIRSLPSLRTLPEHAETLANQLRSGRMTVRTEHFSGEDYKAVDFWVDRFVIALVAGFSVVASAVLLLAAGVTSNHEVRSALWILGFTGLAFSTTLAMRSAARSLRRHLERVE